MTKITVLGGGAMGTACSIVLSERPELDVTLWLRDSTEAEAVSRLRENRRYLPGARLCSRMQITSDADAALADVDWIVAAVPTAFLRETLQPLCRAIGPATPMVSVIKGLEFATFQRPSEIIQDVCGPRPVVALCGPSHAEEIARRLPASLVAASTDVAAAEQVQRMFSTDRFRVYTNRDLLGVELAGALKNVMAVAAGISDGLGYGDNAKAALLTRGIVEMSRFGVDLGADPQTFWGLAGIGDLVTTCFSPFGRNRRVGLLIGEGQTLEEALHSFAGIAEGVNTCRSVYHLAMQRGIDMPIVTEVYRVLFEGRNPGEATRSLMNRPPRSELLNMGSQKADPLSAKS